MIYRQKLLIISHNHETANKLNILFTFLGFTVDIVSCNDFSNVANIIDRYLATIISDQLVLVKNSKCYPLLMSALESKNKLNRCILYSEEKNDIDDVLLELFLGHLTWPFSQNNLLTLISKAQIASEQYCAQPDIKSMNLLINNFVGQSHSIIEVRKLLLQVSKSNATVLVTGESGTGKEIAARLIHELSPRSKQPFVPVNCGAIPSELLESELFGHEKGAFTGAINSRQGRFELAKNGTLFLDEIGDMPLAMQVKLLRVLQEKTFERVGSNKTLTANVRIIAATNCNLENNIKNGKFREDLFYRLNVFPITLPPLRERTDDIPLLISTFIDQHESLGENSIRVLDEAMNILMNYNWPGNVRELYNLIERLIILYPNSTVSRKDLPNQFVTAQTVISSVNHQLHTIDCDEADNSLLKGDMDLKQHLLELEINFIKQALLDSNWIVSHAASRLGIRRTTLVEKIRKFGLSRHLGQISQKNDA